MNETIKEHSWIPLILVIFASFIITLDTTFMNVSISQVVGDLNTDVTTIQTIMSFYTLITASFMLLSSKLQDIAGKKKIFLIGAGIYGAGTTIAAISQNSAMLFIGWALLEGIGGALMTPAAVSIISGTYHGERRTTALAIESAVVAIAAAIGPLFGGVVTTFLSWRVGFASELLIVLIIFILNKKIPDFIPTASKDDLDIGGAVISIIGLILFIIGILMLSDDTATSIAVMILGIIFLAVFTLFEMKRKRKGNVPLFDVELLKDKNLRIGTELRLLVNLGMGGALFAVSLYLETVLDLSAFMTGLCLLPLTLGLLVFAMIAPRFSSKLNHKLIIALGFIVAIIGCLILSYQFTLTTTITDLLPGLFILGAGLGFVMALSLDLALANIPEESQNNASGFATTGQTLGSSMGTAIIGVILILGVIGGINDAVDTYAPEYSSDMSFHEGLLEHFETLGNDNLTEIAAQNSVAEKIINTVIQDSMAIVMQVTALILAIGFVLTLRLKDKKIKK